MFFLMSSWLLTSSCILFPFQMHGEWYLSSHTNYSTLSVLGNILNITRGPAESLVIQHAELEDQESSVKLSKYFYVSFVDFDLCQISPIHVQYMFCYNQLQLYDKYRLNR